MCNGQVQRGRERRGGKEKGGYGVYIDMAAVAICERNQKGREGEYGTGYTPFCTFLGISDGRKLIAFVIKRNLDDASFLI